MKASIIFTSNDVLINFGVIAAGILVLVFQSNIPDLVIGTIVFLIVTKAAVKIYRLGK
jgi:Co/Zn/Cd efflux system component